MKKRMAALLCAALCIAALGALAEGAFAPIPYEAETAPYLPHEECYLPEKEGYHDDSIDVRIVRSRAYDTDYMAVYIRLTDPSQLRCGLAEAYPSKKTAMVVTMAERYGGVLTINGDYFNYHNQGIVARNGEMLRFRPTKLRDTLIIDENGDFLILPQTTKADFEAYTGTVMHAFCFGPGVVKNGVPITKEDIKQVGVDIGKNKNTQRLAICQIDTLYYMVLCTEGPSGGNGDVGFNMEQLGQLCAELGAKWAYNLDGGNSAAVVLGTEKLNNVACTKRRMIGDCIYFCTLVP